MVSLGLIGYPLGHSFSPAWFGEKFAKLGIEGSYRLFPIPDIGELPALLSSNPELQGFNVTVPYKERILPYLDSIDRSACEIGAVNTVKVNCGPDGHRRLVGYNTDWDGFRKSLEPLLRPDIRKALVLGTGGAAHAVGYALGKLGIHATYVSRHPGSSVLQPALSYSELTSDILKTNLLIVNTTPLGMSPHTDECPEIDYGCLIPKHVLYDLIYNPSKTLFLLKGEEQGATVKNGLEMLHLQADYAWEIWTR